MISQDIQPITCSKGFGNPSGHSSSASLFAIVVFLDYFHGTPIETVKNGLPKIQRVNKVFYIVCLLFSIYWAASIPYSRFLLGAHSLDQVVYGSTLGVWEAFTLHWLVRDNLIRHMNEIKQHKYQTTYKDIENQQADTSINDDLRQFSVSLNKKAEHSGSNISLILFIVYIIYESLSIITFLIID